MSRWHRKRGLGHRVARRDRVRVLNDHDWKCAGCGTRGGGLELDHVVPLADGGTHTPDNLQPLCRACHIAKTRTENGGAVGSNEWGQFAVRRR